MQRIERALHELQVDLTRFQLKLEAADETERRNAEALIRRLHAELRSHCERNGFGTDCGGRPPEIASGAPAGN